MHHQSYVICHYSIKLLSLLRGSGLGTILHGTRSLECNLESYDYMMRAQPPLYHESGASIDIQYVLWVQYFLGLWIQLGGTGIRTSA